jgi:hypothetical protein
VRGPVHGGLGEVTGDGAWTVCFWSVGRFISGAGVEFMSAGCFGDREERRGFVVRVQ